MEALDRCITGRGQATDGSSSLRWWAMARPVAAALLIGIATPTFASDPLVGITVAAVSGTETVSNSRPPLITYMAFKVDVVNNSTNTINNVRLVGSTSVAAASFVPSSGLACVTTTGANVIECSIGQLRGSGAGSAPLSWYFRRRRQGRPSTSIGRFTTVKARTTAAGPRTRYDHRRSAGGARDAEHDKTQDLRPAGRRSFYTAGVAIPGDKWTTTVNVPSATTADVEESTDDTDCAAPPPDDLRGFDPDHSRNIRP
jgi:hypothetical protein